MDIIALLKSKLARDQVLTGADLATRYHHIWKMDEGLQAKALVIPQDTKDLSMIMRICHMHDQPVVVHGGLTNLVGSTESTTDDLVISTERFNKVIEVDPGSRTITVEAGVILEHIHEAVAEVDMLFPLNFGAKGSARIGGIISTNAGGLRVFRYGMTRNLVLGLEVVLADGTVINSMKKIIKDNSAYDLKQLFIGSEGTLGIITKAVLRLVEQPTSRTSAFVAFNEYDRVVSFLKYMDAGMAGTLSGYELIWGDSYKCMTSPPSLAKPPIMHGYKYYVLLEGLGSNIDQDQNRLEQLLTDAMDKDIILDASIAYTQSDLNWFWRIREDVHALVSQCTLDQHFDISLPIPEIGKVIDSMSSRLSHVEGIEHIFPFGHVADGNVHFIIGKEHDHESLTDQINDIIYGPLQGLGGSVSAEHGIGVHKKKYLSLCRTAEEIALMQSMKHALDPKNILNRGKVL